MRTRSLLRIVGVLAVATLAVPLAAAAQCPSTGSQSALSTDLATGSQLFDVLGKNALRPRDGVLMEEVRRSTGEHFLRFVSTNSSTEDVGVNCICPICNPVVSNCTIVFNNNVARCIGSCQNQAGGNFLCQFVATPPPPPS
jgi:hypothetical protein